MTLSTELWQLSATDIATLVRQRNLSATAVTEAAFERMRAVNPGLNAVVQSCEEDAQREAAAIDAAVERGEPVGPLAGVPVTVKVNIDQRGYVNTNGLQLQKDLVAESDHPVVTNLRNAGAIIIGRTNTPAFSCRWFTRNRIHGATLNPVNPALTPGGSSGGAASAAASGMGAIAHGTDIAGSIRYPAYACGIHGLRPTIGRVPAYNASGPDRMLGGQMMVAGGPLARTMDDIEQGLLAMSSESALDPWWVPAPYQQKSLPRKVALSFPEDWALDERVEKRVREAAAVLQDQGWQVTELPCPDLQQAARLNLNIWMSDSQMGAGEMIEKEADPDASFVFQEMIGRCEDASDNGMLQRAIQARAGIIRTWQLFLQDYPLVLCPVSAEPPFEDHRDVRSAEDFATILEAQRTQIALPLLGLPVLTVSKPETSGLPIGVQLIGPRFREDLLIEAGKAIESQWGRIPVATPAQ